MPISRKKLIRRFRQLGFTGPLSGGKHQFMIKGDLKIKIPNPHGIGDISDALVNEILRQAGISKEEWEQDNK
jgi:predicted RNA binding protein YcfA (HicA-like mRNA interferase family)